MSCSENRFPLFRAIGGVHARLRGRRQGVHARLLGLCPEMTLNRIMRVAGWLLLAAAAFLTLSPRRFRPETGLEHHVEHLAAFALLGFVFGLGYPRLRP